MLAVYTNNQYQAGILDCLWCGVCIFDQPPQAAAATKADYYYYEYDSAVVIRKKTTGTRYIL